MLLDENLEMYDRYAALFALRNEGGMEAVRAIIAALGCQSALLKHEVTHIVKCTCIEKLVCNTVCLGILFDLFHV